MQDAGRFRGRRVAEGRRLRRESGPEGILPAAVLDGTGLQALQDGARERRPDWRDFPETGNHQEKDGLTVGETGASARGLHYF